MKLPKYCYLVGIYGVILTVLGSICVSKIGATITMAASILGQYICSSIVDHFGFFGNMKRCFTITKIRTYILICVGIYLCVIF